MKKKLTPSPNSLGFLIRHIIDVELLFTKTIFSATEVKVIAKNDTGEWTNLYELKEYSHYAYQNLLAMLEKQTDADWDTTITKSEFGTKTKAEVLGRIVSHTTYHAG